MNAQANATPVDAADALFERYFHAMDDADFERALGCFSDDVFYSHPPYHSEPPGTPRHEVRGQDDLRALFERRGRKAWTHVLDTIAARGDHALVEGRVHDLEGVEIGSFVSAARLTADGAAIRWYAAYYSVPPVSAPSIVGGASRGRD